MARIVLSCNFFLAIASVLAIYVPRTSFIPPCRFIDSARARTAWTRLATSGPVRMTQSPGESSMLPDAPKIAKTTAINEIKNNIMDTTTAINAVDKDLKQVENEMSQVKAAIDGKGVYLGTSDTDKLFNYLNTLLEDKKQLREDKKQLRYKENLLLEKEKQLRDEMLRLTPSSGEVSKRLLDFSENLTKATLLADNVLRLPKDVFFLGELVLRSELFVRKCYVKLKNIIFKCVRHGQRSVILSGTPGTGKSVFALYLLYKLRRQGKTVVVQSKDNWYRFSDEDGVQKWGPGEVIRSSYLDDENAWYLCDPKGKGEPLQSFQGVTIVTISPDPRRVHDFCKQLIPVQLFMAMWTLDELKQCGKLIYPQVTENDIEYAYKRAGGVARLAFNKILLIAYSNLLEERAKAVSLEDLQSAVSAWNTSMLPTKVLGDKLLSIYPRDGYDVYDVMWASTDAKATVEKVMDDKGLNMVKVLARSDELSGPGLSGTEYGIIFERLAHIYLSEERLHLRRYILGGDGVDTFKFWFNGTEGFDGASDLIPKTLRKNVYYKPTKDNFNAIDAFGECNDVLYLFQMKRSGATFPVPLLKNDKLLAKWGKPRIENTSGQSGGYRKCVYVYVVPNIESTKSENFDKVVKKAKKHNPSARAKEEGVEGVEQDSRDSKAEAMSIDEVWVIETPSRVKPGIGLPPEQQ